MRHVATFALLGCLACGGRTNLFMGVSDSGGTAPPSVQDGGAASEVLYLLPSSATGVTTTAPLLAGATYEVIVQGTISVWTYSSWANVCAGTPAPAPLFPSPGVTGPVGVDAEWVWAWPDSSPSLCPGGRPDATPPVAQRKVRIQTNGDAPFGELPPPVETAMTADHAYTYLLTGEGEAATFLVTATGHNPDGSPHVYDRSEYYGELRIQITRR